MLYDGSLVIVALFILNQYIIGLIPYTVWRCVVYWHCPHNMRNRPGLCYRRPSICLSHSLAACCCCGFAVGPAPRRVGDIVGRSGRRAPQPAARRATLRRVYVGSVTFSAGYRRDWSEVDYESGGIGPIYRATVSPHCPFHGPNLLPYPFLHNPADAY